MYCHILKTVLGIYLRRSRFRYSVSEAEAERFVEENRCIHEFLNMYDSDGVTYGEKSIGLARFFRWLEVVKHIELSPSNFLNTHLQKTKANSVEERRWALRLALEYSRDNPDLKGTASSYRYSAWFLPVKMFCDYHEAPLTTRKGFFPKRGRVVCIGWKKWGKPHVPLLWIRNSIFHSRNHVHVKASDKANFSRAVKGLEAKGLIATCNWNNYPGRKRNKVYRTHAVLTKLGVDFLFRVRKKLTNKRKPQEVSP